MGSGLKKEMQNGTVLQQGRSWVKDRQDLGLWPPTQSVKKKNIIQSNKKKKIH